MKRDENIKEKAIRIRVIASEEDFKQPHFAMAADHVTVVLAKFAQGVHILAKDELRSTVMVDHLPANTDLIK